MTEEPTPDNGHQTLAERVAMLEQAIMQILGVGQNQQALNLQSNANNAAGLGQFLEWYYRNYGGGGGQ